MTQKIFDTDNEEDMKLLWSILPSRIKHITKENPFTYDGKLKLINIAWHDKTEIKRPVDYEDMIGCVGWFHDTEEVDKKHDRFSILCSIKNGYEHLFRDEYKGSLWKHFTPAKKSELKFWGD